MPNGTSGTLIIPCFVIPWAGESSSDAQLLLVPALRQGEGKQLLLAVISVAGETPQQGLGDPLRELCVMCWPLRGVLEHFGSYLKAAYSFVGMNQLKSSSRSEYLRS